MVKLKVQKIHLRTRCRSLNNRDFVETNAAVSITYGDVEDSHYTVCYLGEDNNAKPTKKYVLIPRENVLSVVMENVDKRSKAYSMKTFRENLAENQTEETQEA